MEARGHCGYILLTLGFFVCGFHVTFIGTHFVAFLIDEGMLGGFHFNDSHYADDDLTTGSIDPYRTFRIFLEIIQAEAEQGAAQKNAPSTASPPLTLNG